MEEKEFIEKNEESISCDKSSTSTQQKMEKNEANEKEIVKSDNYKVNPPSLFTRFVKRTFDICSSGLAIIILLPFFILFTPIVAIAMKGNPFFTQERAGKNGKPFKVIKYRSMNNKKDKDGNLLPNEQRITKFGKIMRKLSIDELPQLFNIFVGQMSVVGPRPLHVYYIPRYNDFQKQRLLVTPGLTGLAQVSGRNAISWEEKFNKDVEYIKKMSFMFDIKIIFLTVVEIFKKDDIDGNGEMVGSETFMGTNNIDENK